MNEREFIRRIEALDAPKFAEQLLLANPEEKKALCAHFGDEAYERMRDRAAEAATRAEPRGNVVVLHGIMGGELTYYETDAKPEGVWLKLFRIMRGGFDLLPLAHGASVNRISPTGILKRYYGEQLLSLMQQGWNTHAYWFDWRLDIREAADELANRMGSWFKRGGPVHLVAHSMGGLVARAFIHRHPDLWKAMWDEKGNGAAGGRLVMLGTPNHGSFAIPQLFFGLNGSVRKLALLDLHHSLHDLLEIVTTFTGTYQMLPSPLKMPAMEPLYSNGTYAPLAIPQEQLDAAKAFHAELAGDAATTDPGRMIYIAGCDQPTSTGIRDWRKLTSLDGYEVTRKGDGTVPHALGLLDGVPTFYTPVEHGAMPCDAGIMTALDEILAAGRTGKLPAQPPEPTRGDEESARKELINRAETEELSTLEMVAPLKAAVRSRGASDAGEEVSDSERQVEDLVVREFVGGSRAPQEALTAPVLIPTAMGVTASAGTIRIRLSSLGIQKIDSAGDPPVDAIAVGHYIGVLPAGAELALDRAISEGMPSPLLTTFTERGVLRGEIGQPFFLSDPREARRLIAIAGLGQPGRCGTPELTVAVRELAWTLGRLGKRHLATVLIGSGEGNLSAREAVCAWLEGLCRALAQAGPGAGRLEQITFVESSPGKLLGLHRALASATKENVSGLTVEVSGPSEKQLEEEARAEAVERAKTAALQSDEDWSDQADSTEATRLTVDLEEHVFRYSAITRNAAVPERRIILDADLVNEANDAIAAASDAIQQAQLGRYLLKLLFPSDLLKQLATAHPLVITCDATAARIHWEMIAQPDMGGAAGAGDVAFLGIHRGLTRQLRTQFAPPPEPAPPSSRVLRVLIVADASQTDPLPGARKEGERVRELFNSFRAQELSKPIEMRRVAEVEVVALIGPAQATRTRLMQELLLRPYDILHYAGHCTYDKDRPSASGWIFTGNKRLSANELSRVDQVPKFVFSNACESGINTGPLRGGPRGGVRNGSEFCRVVLRAWSAGFCVHRLAR